MLNEIVESLDNVKVGGLARTFRRLGRIGFWLLFRTTSAYRGGCGIHRELREIAYSPGREGRSDAGLTKELEPWVFVGASS